MPLLMCLNEEELDYVARELHEWIYESHMAGMSLAFKTLKSGYFSPTMKADALDLVKRLEKCQRHTYVPTKPFGKQLPLMVTWIIELFGGSYRIFYKWIEIKPLATITA